MHVEHLTDGFLRSTRASFCFLLLVKLYLSWLSSSLLTTGS